MRKNKSKKYGHGKRVNFRSSYTNTSDTGSLTGKLCKGLITGVIAAALLCMLFSAGGCQMDRTVTTRYAIFRGDENGPDNNVAESRRAGMTTGTGWMIFGGNKPK